MLLREYFRTEAAEQIRALEVAADAGPDSWNPAEVRRSARALRALAKLAAEPRMEAAAAAIDQGARESADSTDAAALVERLRGSVDDLRILLDAEAQDGEACLQSLLERWREPLPDVEIPQEPGEESDASFRTFVAREADAIAETMDRAIRVFTDTPSNREPLAWVLRRQRPLLGAARLDTVPIVAEALRAVDELSELIVRLNVPVKSEWLDVFRTAREVLRASSVSLDNGNDPPMTPALSRLRTLREELTDRYGERAQSMDASKPETRAATSGARASTAAAIVRQRAAALHAEIARALGDDPRARAALDELLALVYGADV